MAHDQHATDGGRLLAVAEHRDAVLALVAPLRAVDIEVAHAAGHVLAADVVAPTDLPAWDNSAMDGWAVRRDDVLGATPDHPVTLRVLADLPAGSDAEPQVTPGTAARIMTGAPVPPGADAVVPVEHTDGFADPSEHVAEHGDRSRTLRDTVRIDREPAPGAHIRRAGEDVHAGDVVLRAGTLLGPARVAAAASAGAAAVRVHRRPRVVVVPTGSELVPPGQTLRRGQVADSNSLLLLAAAEAAGCEARRTPAVPDDPARLRAVLTEQEAWADLVVTTGGVSVGAYDVVKAALTGWGDVRFVRVAMQPGKPQGLGRLPGGTPVLSLPGNPVSAHVSFEAFVRPALLRLRGVERLDRPTMRATVVDGWRTPAGRAQYMPVALERDDDGVLRARRAVAGGSGSHLVAGLAQSDGLALVDRDVAEVHPGDVLPVFRTGG
ncbi:MAG: molybdopterin molybdotransferase MoeA [Actinotalea sp.]|nr:molybdopterin molybdotransferase MoeA [Actinotalea sp.]